MQEEAPLGNDNKVDLKPIENPESIFIDSGAH